MNSEQFTILRKRANMTQAEVAQALGLTTRSIASWENADPPRVLSLIETSAVRSLFQEKVLGPSLRDMCKRAFAAIPSELVGIWLVQADTCHMFPEASLYHKPGTDQPAWGKLHLAAPLVIVSLTSYPLRSGETINLAGKAILEHPAKRNKGSRESYFLGEATCESLLKVPEFVESVRGPQPVLLLSFENKFENNGNVIKVQNQQETIYNEQEVKKAKELTSIFREEIIEDVRLLDMIE